MEIRNSRFYSLRLLLLLAALAVPFAALGQSLAKRPLTHNDYDAWRNIQNQQLSPDGKFLVYAIFPQEGDGEVVVRNLATGAERREPAGARPPLPAPDPLTPEARPEPPRVNISFSADSRTLVFSTFPSRDAVDKARRAAADKKTLETPRSGMVIMDLTSANEKAVTRIPSVRNFQVPDTGGGFIAWQRETDAPATAPDANNAAATGEPAQDRDQGRRSGSGTRASGGPAHPSDLVLRKLADRSERVIPGVLEYSLGKDASTLVYATGDGVYALDTASSGEPRPLSTNKAKYSKLAWNEEQTALAFLTDRDGGKFSVYLWDRHAPAANSLVTTATAGFRADFAINEKGGVSFSRDGRSLYLGCAPPSPKTARAAPAPQTAPLPDDQPRFDLWHWQDDFIQPLQKIHAAADRDRTYRAVFHLADGKFVQLADAAMADAAPSDDGRWALGADDRDYRRMVEYDARYADAYLVDAFTGNRKLLRRKHHNAWSWSPDSRYLVTFDGLDWISTAAATAAVVNLTAKLGVKFGDEQGDQPAVAPSYGTAGWTKDGRWLLLYDRYDIWQVAPDGSSARNLTAGMGRKQHTEFRYVRLDPDPRARDIDPAQPLLLRAENEDTRDSGFWRVRLDGSSPRELIMAPGYFTSPIKARQADVLALTRSTFREFPDLLVTDSSFATLRKVSDANPQQKDLLWGSSELVRFKNLDGVPLSGMLVKPGNFDPNKKYPMLVYIYERLSQSLHRYVEPRPMHSINASYYASNGYLVLMPDIVYTTGYPGQSALKCVLPAIQAVVDRGFVDEKAIGIQGHSWGGYQIAYMVTQTNRFRAVAAGAPVANMISAYDGVRWGSGLPRQFQYEKTQSRIGGTLWEYPQRFIENSPIFMADRVRTPIMLLHNDADDAVPWYQGIEYYLALRRLGKEVYLFVYNGEPHGLRRRPNQKDYTVRLQQYFDHFLKGAPEPDWMRRGIPYVEAHP